MTFVGTAFSCQVHNGTDLCLLNLLHFKSTNIRKLDIFFEAAQVQIMWGKMWLQHGRGIHKSKGREWEKVDEVNVIERQKWRFQIGQN